jgi:FMN phosphatase YigB (HAD superfamily)
MKTVIFDWKRTLYDPDNKILIPGAEELLTFLKQKNISLVLIGKGTQEMHDEVERLGLKDYFNHIFFREGAKDSHLFAQYIKKDSPKETIFIGDRVRSELAVGNNLGATTIWVKQGKFAREEPENENQIPTFTVPSLSSVKALF